MITACSELVTAHREEETMLHQHCLHDEDTACQEDHLGMLKPECHGTFIRTGFTPNRSVSLLSESDTAANLDRSPLGCQRSHAAKHQTHHVGDSSHGTEQNAHSVPASLLLDRVLARASSLHDELDRLSAGTKMGTETTPSTRLLASPLTRLLATPLT